MQACYSKKRERPPLTHFDNTILQAIPEPALIATHGRVTCFNPPAAALFPDLADGAPLPDPLPPQGKGAGLLLAGGQSYHFTASPVGSGTLFLLHAARLEGMSRDQLDGTVRRLREQMGQLLLSIQLMSQQAQEDCRDRLAGMNRTLCQMLRLTDQLDLLRDLESGGFQFTPVTMDLAGLCREVSAACTYLLEQVGVSLAFESPLTSLLVNGDSELLQKLLLELLVNAARAAGKGGQITMSLSRRDSRAVLTLAGPGKDDGRSLPQLLSGSGSEDRIPQPGEGAGTGLILAQRIVSLHTGTLMMERREGIHTIVALPLAKKGDHLRVRAPRHDYTGGFSPELIILSDLLPNAAFSALDVE